MSQLEADWLETTKDLPKEEYDQMGMTIHFYLKGKTDSEEVSFYGEMKYRLLDSCIAFLEDDTNTFFAYDCIEQIFIDKTG